MLTLLLGLFCMVSTAAADVSTRSFRGEEAETRQSKRIIPFIESGIVTDPNGRPVPSMEASLTIGKGGPILLQDTNFINHVAHFNRENIPARVVHAKGGGAHGVFQVTHDITQYTRAAPFTYVGKTTPIFVRFSTVTFERGSADTALTDPRGFAIKFYTDEGNWDLVGQNLPIFPIRDPMLFPSLIRNRRDARTHRRNQNLSWDFQNRRPETVFHTLQQYSHLGFPDGWRYMNGSAVHAFKLVNAKGDAVYAKLTWNTNQGPYKFLGWDESKEICGKNPNYSIEDLYRAIEREDYPSWTMYIQVMTLDQVAKFRWNPFDATKIWPEDEFPLIEVGRLTLNRNPVDYFTEVEMAAFEVGSLIPGIEFSPDPLLIGRAFSYADAQRHRLGPNFQQLPINRPLAKVNSFARDGQCAMDNGKGGPNYFPNSFDNLMVAPIGTESWFHVSGDVFREDTIDEDNFSQARIWLRTLTTFQREFMVKNIGQTLRGVSEIIHNESVRLFREVEPALGDEIQAVINA